MKKLTIITAAFLSFNCNAQEKKPDVPKTYVFTAEKVQAWIQFLAKKPYEDVAPVIMDISQEVYKQEVSKTDSTKIR